MTTHSSNSITTLATSPVVIGAAGWCLAGVLAVGLVRQAPARLVGAVPVAALHRSSAELIPPRFLLVRLAMPDGVARVVLLTLCASTASASASASVLPITVVSNAMLPERCQFEPERRIY